jgi:hypothetical protein
MLFFFQGLDVELCDRYKVFFGSWCIIRCLQVATTHNKVLVHNKVFFFLVWCCFIFILVWYLFWFPILVYFFFFLDLEIYVDQNLLQIQWLYHRQRCIFRSWLFRTFEFSQINCSIIIFLDIKPFYVINSDVVSWFANSSFLIFKKFEYVLISMDLLYRFGWMNTIIFSKKKMGTIIIYKLFLYVWVRFNKKFQIIWDINNVCPLYNLTFKCRWPMMLEKKYVYDWFILCIIFYFHPFGYGNGRVWFLQKL